MLTSLVLLLMDHASYMFLAKSVAHGGWVLANGISVEYQVDWEGSPSEVIQSVVRSQWVLT